MENFILSPIALSDLQGLISDSVQEALRTHTEQQATPKPEIVDGLTLEKKLGITRQTLGRWRAANRIPFIQQGGVIRYDLNKVIEALERKKTR